MADTKISAMPGAALPLTGAELIPVVQSSANKKTTVADVASFNRSYGAWSDSTDQTGSTTSGTAITFNTVDIADGITLSESSKFEVPNNGVYDLQFSAQLKNADNVQHDAIVWARVNGEDVANTATKLTVPGRKSAEVLGYAVAAWNFFLSMNSGDYVELIWLPTSSNVTIEALPASVSPAYPATPSIILTMSQVG